MAAVLDDRELQRIYSWVDEIPLSRPKRSITRDFSDGVLMAELVHHDQRHNKKDQDQEWPYDPTDEPK